MHWADINALLYKAGSSPTDIARDLNCNPASVSETIRGDITSKRIAKTIAKVTGKPLHILFPDGRYTENPNSQRAVNLKRRAS